MATSEILGLFTTPEQYQQSQRQLQEAQAIQYANLDPRAKADYGFYSAGQQLANTIGGALGGQDPQLKLISQRQQLASQLDQTDPNSYRSLARIAASSGDPQFAILLAQEGMKIEKEGAQLAEYKGVQAERERSATEKQTVIASRVKALMEANVVANENEARAIASNEGAFTEAMGLSKLTPAAKAEKSLYAQASQIYPNDSVAQYQYVENIKAGAKPPTDAEVKDIAEVKQANSLLEGKLTKTDDYLKLVTGANPKVTFGVFSNIKAAAEATGIFGEPSENTRIQDDIRSYLIEGVQTILNAAVGVQAKDDAIRAQKQVEGYLKLNTNTGAVQALNRLKQGQAEVLKSNEVYLQSRVRTTPNQPQSGTSPTTGATPASKVTPASSATPTSRVQELLNKASPEQRKLLGK
jgi:hypothetical protein